jgi:ribose-phosphate pyrophosphokinase
MSPAARLHGFADTAFFARRLADATDLPLATVRVHRFPDGETLVRVAVPPGRHAYVVRSLHDPNPKLVETALAADALRRAGAARVTLLAPYLPYMRQDRVFRSGEPVSQQVVGGWLGDVFDGVITIEAHLHRVRRLADVIAGRSRSLSAGPAVSTWLGRAGRTWVIGPDAESEPWIRTIARAAGASWVVARKTRHGDRRVTVRVPEVPADARAVIVDDVASSGATIAATARALRRQGVHTVDAVVAHAIFAPGAEQRIRASGVRRLVSCDTIAHSTNAIRVAPLMAAALARSA